MAYTKISPLLIGLTKLSVKMTSHGHGHGLDESYVKSA
jgi:hypothetical protein